jgi:hypothetical protein
MKNLMKSKKESIFTDPTRDFVLLECAGGSHGPFGQRRVVSKGGKEGFQLKVWAKRIRWPLCGDMPKSLLCMPEMVYRHGCCSDPETALLYRMLDTVTWHVNFYQLQVPDGLACGACFSFFKRMASNGVLRSLSTGR